MEHELWGSEYPTLVSVTLVELAQRVSLVLWQMILTWVWIGAHFESLRANPFMFQFVKAIQNGTWYVRVKFPNFGLGHLGGLGTSWQSWVLADDPDMNLDWWTVLVPFGKPFHAPLWNSNSKWNMICEGPIPQLWFRSHWWNWPNMSVLCCGRWS